MYTWPILHAFCNVLKLSIAATIIGFSFSSSKCDILVLVLVPVARPWNFSFSVVVVNQKYNGFLKLLFLLVLVN